MSKTIQLRNVPDAVHRRLKTQAAKEGVSLSDDLVGEFGKIVERPALAEMHARLDALPASDASSSPTVIGRNKKTGTGAFELDPHLQCA